MWFKRLKWLGHSLQQVKVGLTILDCEATVVQKAKIKITGGAICKSKVGLNLMEIVARELVQTGFPVHYANVMV